MEIDIESMDKQHKRWIELMNNLHEAIQHRMDKSVIEKAMIGILFYTRIHFEDEERLLLLNDYPDYANHKKLHDDFIEQLKVLKQSQEKDQQSDWLLIMKLMDLMSKWLINHIQKADRKYAFFLKEKGVQ